MSNQKKVDITPEDSVVPVYSVTYTKEEEAERAQWAVDELEKEAEAERKTLARSLAQEKLAKLGLTEEDIRALIGD